VCTYPGDLWLSFLVGDFNVTPTRRKFIDSGRRRCCEEQGTRILVIYDNCVINHQDNLPSLPKTVTVSIQLNANGSNWDKDIITYLNPLFLPEIMIQISLEWFNLGKSWTIGNLFRYPVHSLYKVNFSRYCRLMQIIIIIFSLHNIIWLVITTTYFNVWGDK